MTVYHIGNLAIDRVKNPELDRTADQLWRESIRHEIVLYQTRIREDVFAYSFVPLRDKRPVVGGRRG